MDVVIRSVDADAVLEVHRLQQMWCQEQITWGYVPDTVDNLTAQIGPFFLLAMAAGDAVGYVLGKTIASVPMAALDSGKPCLEIIDLYVVSARRAQGIGGLLLKAILQRAAKQGISQCKLFSGTKDIQRVMSFYQRHGFEPVAVEMVCRLEERGFPARP